MIKMVVFDMAGTVVDEGNVVYKTLRKAINEEGYAISLEQVLSEGAGKEKFQAIKDILENQGSYDPTITDKAFRNFKMYLTGAYDGMEIKPQPGAEELFHELKKENIYVVLNTGYDMETAQTILNKIRWREGREIDALITATHVVNNRPAPDMIEFAKRKFALTPSDQVVKVGDSAIDIEEGQNAGCYLTIGITTGAQSREQIKESHPDYIVDALADILPLLNGRS
jgi:phosphonatase-like hydrolase